MLGVGALLHAIDETANRTGDWSSKASPLVNKGEDSQGAREDNLEAESLFESGVDPASAGERHR